MIVEKSILLWKIRIVNNKKDRVQRSFFVTYIIPYLSKYNKSCSLGYRLLDSDDLCKQIMYRLTNGMLWNIIN